MSNRILLFIVLITVLILAAAGFYRVRDHSASSGPATTSAAEPRPLPASNLPAPEAIPEPSPEILSPDSGATTPLSADPGVDKPHPLDVFAPQRVGEVWEFSANVSKLSNVATLQLKTVEKKTFFGKPAWHLQAFAHTQNPLRMVFSLDDRFDSYSDAASLSSLQYEMHLNERGQSVESVQRMITGGRDPAPANATAARVLSGTRDPLGMMQYLRTVNWSKTQEVRSPVYDGHKLYDARARVKSSAESVSVPAGNFNCFKIELRVFDNGVELNDANFMLYLSNDDRRAPVLLEAVMPFATARVELQKAH